MHRGASSLEFEQLGEGPLKWHLPVVLHVNTEPLNNFRKSKEHNRRHMVASSRKWKWLSSYTGASLMGEAGEGSRRRKQTPRHRALAHCVTECMFPVPAVRRILCGDTVMTPELTELRCAGGGTGLAGGWLPREGSCWTRSGHGFTSQSPRQFLLGSS